MARVWQGVRYQSVLLIFGLCAMSCSKICLPGCRCIDKIMHCKCLPGRDMALNSSLQVRTEHLYISHCDRLEVQRGAFNQMNLTTLGFESIKVLEMRMFAVVTTGNIDTIFINHVSDLKLESFSISVQKLSRFQLLNTTARSLPEYAISIKETTITVIRKCKFEHLHKRSIAMQNVNINQIHDESTFCRINTGAIIFKKVDFIKILNSTFHDLNMSSFSLYSSGSAFISHNSFRELPTRFLKTDTIDRIDFTDNRVGISRKDAFAGVRLISDATVNFSANVFHELEPNSLLPVPIHSLQSLVAVDNSFDCDCHMNWMLEGGALYDAFVNSSSCSNHGGKAMLLMLPLYYSGTQCEMIEEEEGQFTYEEDTQTQEVPTQSSLDSFSTQLTTSLVAIRENVSEFLTSEYEEPAQESLSGVSLTLSLSRVAFCVSVLLLGYDVLTNI